MKILCLYNNEIAIPLFEWLHSQGHAVTIRSSEIDSAWCVNEQFDLAVSYTYRYILSEKTLEALHHNAVNIHNAFLPFNRGANPNLWSILEGTPRGVTIHYMDSKVDCGDIISQVLIDDLIDEETLKTTYDRLDREAKKLFKATFKNYSNWRNMRKKADGTGSYHWISDAEEILDRIKDYDISVAELKRLYCNCNLVK